MLLKKIIISLYKVLALNNHHIVQLNSNNLLLISHNITTYKVILLKINNQRSLSSQKVSINFHRINKQATILSKTTKIKKRIKLKTKLSKILIKISIEIIKRYRLQIIMNPLEIYAKNRINLKYKNFPSIQLSPTIIN